MSKRSKPSVRGVTGGGKRLVPILTAVDPGARWTAAAFFDRADNEWGWECVGAVEFDTENDLFVDSLAESVMDNEVPILVFERWHLFEDKAVENTGNEFEEIQVIGQMKFVVRRHNEHCYLHTRALNAGQLTTCELRGASCMDKDIGWQPTLMIGQRSDILKPTQGILRGKGIKSVAKPISKELYGGRFHVVSAELHGWYHILEGSKTGRDQQIYYGD
jgi:hypothetical protein